jgi:protein SCO1
LDLLVRLPSLVLASAGLLGITLAACSRPPDGLQDLPAVQAFQLSSSQGTPFTETDLTGEVWVVNFFFTRCPTICPLLMDGIEGVYQRWADDERVHFLSITVDGGFDTPEVLRAYREARGLPSERWVLATGERVAITKLSEQSFFRAVATQMDESGDILHSSHVLVLDQERGLRGWFDVFDEADHPRLDAVVDYLLKEDR